MWMLLAPSHHPTTVSKRLLTFLKLQRRANFHVAIRDRKLGSKIRRRWVVPVGEGLGKIVHLGKQPVNVYTEFFRNVQRPDGTSSWSARFQMQFLFPKKR